MDKKSPEEEKNDEQATHLNMLSLMSDKYIFWGERITL